MESIFGLVLMFIEIIYSDYTSLRYDIYNDIEVDSILKIYKTAYGIGDMSSSLVQWYLILLAYWPRTKDVDTREIQ